jgi:hypothetical protein
MAQPLAVGFSGGPFAEEWWRRFSPFALFHPREPSALFAATESHFKPNPSAKKSLQAQLLAI